MTRAPRAIRSVGDSLASGTWCYASAIPVIRRLNKEGISDPIFRPEHPPRNGGQETLPTECDGAGPPRTVSSPRGRARLPAASAQPVAKADVSTTRGEGIVSRSNSTDAAAQTGIHKEGESRSAYVVATPIAHTRQLSGNSSPVQAEVVLLAKVHICAVSVRRSCLRRDLDRVRDRGWLVLERSKSERFGVGTRPRPWPAAFTQPCSDKGGVRAY